PPPGGEPGPGDVVRPVRRAGVLRRNGCARGPGSVHYASCLNNAMLVRRTYLEQHDAAQLRPARTPRDPLSVVRVELPSPEFNRYLYVTVGGDWHWRGRLPWAREDWLIYLSQPHTETWVGYVRGTPAGYVELAGRSTEDSLEVEI